MAQWVDMGAEENHALSACRRVTTLLEADSRLLMAFDFSRAKLLHKTDLGLDYDHFYKKYKTPELTLFLHILRDFQFA